MHQSEHRLARFSIQSTCGVGFYGKQVYFASKWCNLLHIQAVASMPVRSLWKKQWGAKCKQCSRMLLVPDKGVWSWLSWQSETSWNDDEMMTWENYEKDCLPRRLGRLSWPNAFPWPPWMIRIRSCRVDPCRKCSVRVDPNEVMAKILKAISKHLIALRGNEVYCQDADRFCAQEPVIQLRSTPFFWARWLEQPVLLIVCAWKTAKGNFTVQLTF